MMRRCELVLASLLLAGLPPLAAADPAKDAEAAYEEGRRLYDLREWDQAIAKFKEAYRLDPKPKSLFNIAQAFRLKGDCVEALSFYRTYKRNFPRQANVGKVQKFITELEPCAKQRRSQPATPRTPASSDKPTVADPPPDNKPDPKRPVEPPRAAERKGLALESSPQPAPEPPPPSFTPDRGDAALVPPPRPETPSNPGRGLRTAGIAVAGVGGVATAVGVYFGLKARSFEADVENNDGEWDPAREENGQSADRNAKLFLGVGAAGLVTGGILYFVGRNASEPAPQVGVVPSTGGAFVVWSGTL